MRCCGLVNLYPIRIVSLTQGSRSFWFRVWIGAWLKSTMRPVRDCVPHRVFRAKRVQTVGVRDTGDLGPAVSGVSKSYVTYFPDLAFPGSDTPEPIIDIDDIADLVVAVLPEEVHIDERYEVTAPRLMTCAEMSEVLATTLGRPIEHFPVIFEDVHAGVAARKP